MKPWPCPNCGHDVLVEMMNGHDCPSCAMPFKEMIKILCPVE